ncbi:MAG: cytochrome P450 [Actinomycetota bacterium]
MGDVAFDPADPVVAADPYPAYARLRAETPVLLNEATGLRFVSRHADVDAVLRDRRFGRVFAPLPGAEMAPFNLLNEHSLFDKEPPEHTRLRGLVSSVFTPRRVEALRPAVRAMAEELVHGGLHDLVADLAEPVPVAVIAELLGVPAADRPQLRPWSRAIVAMFELEPEDRAAVDAVQAATAFRAYLLELFAARRRGPGADLLSALVGVGLSDDELVATCVLLLNAGHEATVHALGNGVLALLEHRSEWERLVADPSLVPAAVEELLRYDTPLQLFRRTALAEAAVGGEPVAEGERVALLLGSANRDAGAFEDPDRLDVGRSPNPHLGFGAGIHFCLGAPLARVEVQEELRALVRRAPGLELAGEPVRRPGLVIRGLETLPVSAVG